MGNFQQGLWPDLTEMLGQRSHRDWITVTTRPRLMTRTLYGLKSGNPSQTQTHLFAHGFVEDVEMKSSLPRKRTLISLDLDSLRLLIQISQARLAVHTVTRVWMFMATVFLRTSGFCILSILLVCFSRSG